MWLLGNPTPEQAAALPLELNHKTWVGIRRLHALLHPGLTFLVVTDGSLRSQSALSIGGYLARMSHARMTLLGVGKDEALLDSYLQDARKQLGNGMASVQVRTDASQMPQAIAKSVEKVPVDLVIVGWRPMEGATPAEQILEAGDHHLLLAAQDGLIVKIEWVLSIEQQEQLTQLLESMPEQHRRSDPPRP